MGALKVVSAFLLALASSMAGYAQEKAPLRISVEEGISVLWNPSGNLSPFGLKHQSAYFGVMPAVHSQLFLSYQQGEAVGIEYQGFQRRASLDDLSAETRIRHNYFALAWAKSSALPRPRFFLRQSFSLGATYTDALAQAWGTRVETKAHAWGLGLNYRLTLAYQLTRSSALGIQLGLGAYSTFRWQGTVAPDAYAGSFLGKDTNLGFYPTLGIVLTNPLGR